MSILVAGTTLLGTQRQAFLFLQGWFAIIHIFVVLMTAHSFIAHSGPLVIVEDLLSRKQAILKRHVEEVGVVTVDSHGIILASSSSPTKVLV